jgi:hypothetical protein
MTFTALLDAHEPPATTVTDELGAAAAADVELLPAPVGLLLLLLPPLLHAAIPVTAAMATIDAAAVPRRFRDAGPVLLVLLGTMGVTPLFFCEGHLGGRRPSAGGLAMNRSTVPR